MKAGNRKISIMQVARSLVQIIFFVLLPGFYASAFSGIKQVYIGVLHHSFSFTGYFTQLVEAVAIIPATILLGRFFCGWMCAFGTLGDIIHHISSKVFKVSFRISERADRAMKYFKFVTLGFIVAVLWTFGVKSFSTANPWNVFGILASFNKAPDISYAFSEFTSGFLILLAIIVASFFVERFFCRYLCPLGAIFVILSRLRVVKIVKPASSCGACRACTKSCAMGIPLYRRDKVSSSECINCFKCIPACPRKNVSMSMAGEDMRTGVAAVMAVSVMAGSCYSGSYLAKESNMNAPGSLISNSAGTSSGNLVLSSPAKAAGNSIYKSGTYEGSGNGFRGGVTTVSVTVENDRITDIQLLSYGDDPPFFNRAYDSVVSEILSNQSTNVDAVSGATFSSMGIMNAVQDALSKAGL